jgi:hypothetical protein
VHLFLKRSLAIGVGLLSIINVTSVYAEGQSGIRSMDRLVHRPDRVVMVYAQYRRYKNNFWRNPDNCDTRKKVALVPNPGNPPETYDEHLATLTAAFMADKQVSFTVDGCYVKPDGTSVPRIRLISVYN